MKAILEHEPLLIFRIGRVACCAPVRDVDSIVLPQDLSSIPGQAQFIAGVFQYRGHTVSVVDTFVKFGLKSPEGNKGRVVMAYTRHGMVGFWVDEIFEITSGYDNDWTAPPQFVGGNIFDRTLLWREKLVLSTDFDRLYSMQDSSPLAGWIAKNEQNYSDVLKPERKLSEQKPEISDKAENTLKAVATPQSVVEQVIPAAAVTPIPEKATEVSVAEVSEVVEVNQETLIEPLPVSDTSELEDDSGIVDSDTVDAPDINKAEPEFISTVAEVEKRESDELLVEDALSIPEEAVTESFSIEENSFTHESVVIRSTEDSTFDTVEEKVINDDHKIAVQAIDQGSVTSVVIREDEQDSNPGEIETKVDYNTENNYTFSPVKSNSGLIIAAAVVAALGVGAVSYMYLAGGSSKSSAVTPSVSKSKTTESSVNEIAIVEETAIVPIKESTGVEAASEKNKDVAIMEHEELSRSMLVESDRFATLKIDNEQEIVPRMAGAVQDEPHLVLEEVVPPFKPSVEIHSPSLGWGSHIVTKGDTLWHLADLYLNNPFRYIELAKWSDITNPDLIYPGENIKYQKGNSK